MADLQTPEQAEAQRLRRVAQWRAKCQCHGPFSHCQCISKCERCGHIRADHDHDYATDTGNRWGVCDVPDCQCGRFVDGEDE